MRIEFLTQDDPLYVLPFFDEFLRHYASRFEIVQVSCSRAMGNRSRLKLLRELRSLYGAIGLAQLLMHMAAARTLGVLPKARNAAHFHSLAQLCRAYGIRYERIGNPNGPEFMGKIGGRASDLIVSVACPYILKQALLGFPKLGCINIHHGPLPRYKGMMPTFWQMYQGEKEVGVTIHYMAEKVDEGAPLFQDKLEIWPGESLHHLIRRSKRHGAHCMAQVLEQIASGTQAALPVDKTKQTYFGFPSLEQIQEFRRRGFRPI